MVLNKNNVGLFLKEILVSFKPTSTVVTFTNKRVVQLDELSYSVSEGQPTQQYCGSLNLLHHILVTLSSSKHVSHQFSNNLWYVTQKMNGKVRGSKYWLCPLMNDIWHDGLRPPYLHSTVYCTFHIHTIKQYLLIHTSSEYWVINSYTYCSSCINVT